MSAVALALALLVTGCSPDNPPKPGAAPSAQPTSQSTILTQPLPSRVTARGVLVGAVLLTTADIKAAIAKKIVTAEEVAAARLAIKDRTLGQWRSRAEADRPK